jgi:hypothetical protein
MLKPVIQSESYNYLSAVINSQSVVESKFPQSSEISEIIAVYPQVSLTSCEVSSGRVNYGGRLILSIVYADEEGKLCRMQKGAEFTHYSDDDSLTPSQTAECNLRCERTQIKRDGSSFVVSIVVAARIEIYSRGERNVLSECEGAVVNAVSKTFYSAVTFSGESEVEDDFEAESVVDILIPAAQVLISNCQCRAGEVSVEGEIYLSLFCMRSENPVCLERVVPFKSSILCDLSSSGNYAFVEADIKELNVNATVNEERGKCLINVVCNLAFDGTFYESSEKVAVSDAFACDRQTDLTYFTEHATPYGEIKLFTERVSGRAATKSKLDYTCRLLAAALPKVEFNYSDDSKMIEGGISATLVYEQNGDVKSTEINLPFAMPLNGIEEGQRAIVRIVVCGVNVKQPVEGELEAEAVIKVGATGYREETCEYVCDIAEGAETEKCDSAVSVVIPFRGDGLWEISKRLKMRQEEVLATNSELTFPLSGQERIIIYRQKK